MLFAALFPTATTIGYGVMCGPHNGQSFLSYLMAGASDECGRAAPLFLLQSAINVLGDLYLVVLPLPAVWSLTLPLPRKLGVAAMFLTGIVCVLG